MFSEGATAVDFVSGLLDQWQYAGNAEAFQLVLKMAAWVHDRVEATINMGGDAPVAASSPASVRVGWHERCAV
jgi:hypothetical protein